MSGKYLIPKSLRAYKYFPIERTAPVNCQLTNKFEDYRSKIVTSIVYEPLYLSCFEKPQKCVSWGQDRWRLYDFGSMKSLNEGFEVAAQWIQKSKFYYNTANAVVVGSIYLRRFNRQVLTLSVNLCLFVCLEGSWNSKRCNSAGELSASQYWLTPAFHSILCFAFDITRSIKYIWWTYFTVSCYTTFDYVVVVVVIRRFALRNNPTVLTDIIFNVTTLL